MKVVVFAPSPASGGQGNAHFLRGVVTELQERGHEVAVHEPAADGRHADLDGTLDDAGLVLVHAGNGPDLVARIGAHRARHNGYRLLFHDTHHRAVTAPEEMARFDLADYDGVLAAGEVIRRAYLEHNWAARAWTWHEAADVRVFHPLPGVEPEADLVWIGDWGDGERGEELRTFLLRPARTARLHGSIYGARYLRSARLRIALARLHYRGRVADDRVPKLFARHRLTVHVPHRPYAAALPGVPTIHPFEAMACGIPLISAPWDDCEGLFRTEQDYLVARDCAEMREAMQAIVEYPELAEKLRASGLETIRSRHTCAHRVDELLAIDAELRGHAHVEFATS
jgi:spore maturation protein CgeB